MYVRFHLNCRLQATVTLSYILYALGSEEDVSCILRAPLHFLHFVPICKYAFCHSCYCCFLLSKEMRPLQRMKLSSSGMGTVLWSPDVAMPWPPWLASLLYWSIWWLQNFCVGHIWAQQLERKGSSVGFVLRLFVLVIWFYVSWHTFRGESMMDTSYFSSHHLSTTGTAMELQD